MNGDPVMIALALFIAFTLVFRAGYSRENAGFFDGANTSAMRGFWCLIIVLVHVPVGRRNPMQDMLGSFAYVGVTFFFLTSAYGLKRGFDRDAASVRRFWRHRLPKLLVPCLLANALTVAARLSLGRTSTPWALLAVDDWVLWLIACYFVFWAACRFLRRKNRDIAVCAAIVGLSVFSYLFQNMLPLHVWPTEILGFAWGVLLARNRDRFRSFFRNRWLAKTLAACALAGALGILYLKFKQAPFWGDYLLKAALGFSILLFMLAVHTRVAVGNAVSLRLGRISYEVYLIHGTVFTAMDAVCTGKLSSGLFILTGIAMTVLISSLFHRLSKTALDRVSGSPR